MEIDYTINDHNSPHKLMIGRNNLGNQMDTVHAFTNEDDINDGHNHINSNNNNKTRSLTPNQLNLITLAENQGILRVQDKGPLIEILTQAGVNVKKKGNLDQEIIDSLPTWTQVTNLYGSAPIIHGLERCKEYRTNVEASTRFLGIAGTFNTGTNLLADLMRFNCQIVERMEVYGKKSKGVRWQVPWGKHFMARYRDTNHTTHSDSDVPKNHTLPLVVTRDPYSWMQSMCRHSYAASWPHNKDHCPNLIASEDDIKKLPGLRKRYGNIKSKDVEKLVPITIKYSKENKIFHDHLSFGHYYSEWYNDYWEADYPRLMVRFEDLLFHGEEVTRKMCHCGGGVPIGAFSHVSQSAKKGNTAHGAMKERTNLIGALIKYGSGNKRFDSMTEDDLIAAQRHFDPKLINGFGYHHPITLNYKSKSMDVVMVKMGNKTVMGTDAGRYDDDHSQRPV